MVVNGKARRRRSGVFSLSRRHAEVSRHKLSKKKKKITHYFTSIGSRHPRRNTKTELKKKKQERRQRRLVQTLLNKRRTGITNAEAYGDQFELHKPQQLFRIAFQNINGINKASFHNDSINFMEKVKKLNSDITGLNKVKLYPPKLASQDQWNIRVKKSIPGAFTRYTYNNTKPHDQPLLAGGVGIIANKEAAVQHKSSSYDPTGLGRWSSILLGG
jgi:hypothetical protein